MGTRVADTVLVGEPHPVYGVAGHAGSGIGGAGPFPRWWADSIGLVQYDAGERYELALFDPSTPIEPKSWAQVKALFRR
jgi:hypothetical protein